MSDPLDPIHKREGRDPGRSERLDGALESLVHRIRERLSPESGDEDWIGLFDELRHRASSLGVRQRSGELDDFGLDREFVRAAAPFLELLRQRWWRIQTDGTDTLPTGGPVLFVANRSGLLPWDGLMVAGEIARRRDDGERPRFLIADWLITLPWVQPAVARLGGVRACRENAERLLSTGRSVVAFPEGAKGATKVYRERYRVQRFGRGGVVRLALELGVPLVPVGIVGAEEAHPILFKLERVVRPFGLPFVPITPTFPLLGPLGLVPLPSQWRISFGEPISTEELGAETANDEIAVARLNEELRQEIQHRVRAGLNSRGAAFG